ncbi:TIR domain-containing protein [Frigoriglobus tundricola]|uniref:TIR domain-containing protein n=1 Tax=Frigoriglobus tundricola TaxID=2774151 RepID=UPI00148EAA74|nr:TIR domain-containing protein [Frigoriglobus tundricola]
MSFLSEDEYQFEFVPLGRDRSLDGFIDFEGTPFDGRVREVVPVLASQRGMSFSWSSRSCQTRTHWALKEKALFDVLVSAGVAGPFFANTGGKLGRVEEMRFKGALSFPGEKRPDVAAVADELKKVLPKGTVFYDFDFTARLARPNLDSLLQRTYLKNSDLVVVFLCGDYERKMWCGIEWRAVCAIVNDKSDHSVVLVRFDQADIPGVLPQDGSIDTESAKFTPVQAAQFILECVRLNEEAAAS